jgi:hypothetical protein
LGALRGRDVPIYISSGYRCLAVNTGIGSDPPATTCAAMAADIKAPAFGTPYEVAQALAPHVDALGIGQLIHEYGSWVHVSTRRPEREVNRIAHDQPRRHRARHRGGCMSPIPLWVRLVVYVGLVLRPLACSRAATTRLSPRATSRAKPASAACG